jgi:hypothetical protein
LLIGDTALALHVGDAVAFARLSFTPFFLLMRATRFLVASRIGRAQFRIATRIGVAPSIGIASRVGSTSCLVIAARVGSTSCLVIAACVGSTSCLVITACVQGAALGLACLFIARSLLAPRRGLTAFQCFAASIGATAFRLAHRLLTFHCLATRIRRLMGRLVAFARLRLLPDDVLARLRRLLLRDRAFARRTRLIGGLIRGLCRVLTVVLPMATSMFLRTVGQRRNREGERQCERADAEGNTGVLRGVHDDLARDGTSRFARWSEAA